MFYQIESLRKGGRFYLCWLADSWPTRFATISRRQLWSYDIRKICDNLLEVVRNESGRPTKRFSLRLSAKLLRGLVRIYKRKVDSLLSDMIMMSLIVMKKSKKTRNINVAETMEDEEVRRPQLQQLEIQETVEEAPVNEQGIEEILQQNGNMVSNIGDITLKEATIPEVLVPPNDGFGEENLGQDFQFHQDRRTLEQMLVQPDVSTALSGLEVPLDISVMSHDKSRLLHEPAQMERVSEYDVTLITKSTGEEFMPEFEKDIPEITEIPRPELPVPEPDKAPEALVAEAPRAVVETEPTKTQEPMEIELEELEEGELQLKKRKIRNRLIVDKKTKIGSKYLRARIGNPLLELRCEDSSDDIIFIRVPAETYFRRPCHGGEKLLSNFGFPISRLFSRNLGVISDRQVEESAEAIRQQSPRTLTESVLENIEEQEAPSVEDRPKVQIEPLSLEANYTMTEMLNVSEPRRVSADKDLDIADMLTQKVETLSQARRRKAVPEIVIESPKRQRSVGYMSSRGSQLAKEQSVFITDVQADKENVPANIQQPQDAESILSAMRQQAGQQEAHSETQRSLPATRKTESDRSETPLGSLDRTKVSLGDSDETTDSKRFLHDQWGTEATMVKILKQIKAGLQPVNVASLLDKGLVIPGYTRIIAARCFVSILNLKKNGYISVKKNPDTLEIADISIGPTLISLKKL